MTTTFSRQKELSVNINVKTPRWTSPASFFGMSVYRFVLLALLVLTVPTVTEANLVNSCVTTYDANVDYFPNKIKVDRAGNFAVEYFKSYKVVTNSKTAEEAVLYQCGTPMPTGFSNDTKIFAIPVSRVGFTSTTELTFLEILGVQSSIKYSDSLPYVSSPCIQALVIANQISPFSSNSSLKDDQINSLDVTFVFSKNAKSLKSMSVSSSSDPSPLGRAEWVEFLSLFFNRENQAEAYFNQTLDRYNCFSTEFKSSTTTPKVAWVSYDSWGKNFVISNAAYKTEYVKDIGAIPVYFEKSNFATVEEWKKNVQDVDYIIDETYLGTLENFYQNFNLTANSVEYKFIKNKQIWKSDRLQNSLGSLDWFEAALPEADSVIQDLGSIIKPEVKIDHKRIWFRNIATGEDIVVAGADACKSVDGPRPPLDGTCEFKTTPESSSQITIPTTFMVVFMIVFYFFI